MKKKGVGFVPTPFDYFSSFASSLAVSFFLKRSPVAPPATKPAAAAIAAVGRKYTNKISAITAAAHTPKTVHSFQVHFISNVIIFSKYLSQ